jgi:hypothetical protein
MRYSGTCSTRLGGQSGQDGDHQRIGRDGVLDLLNDLLRRWRFYGKHHDCGTHDRLAIIVAADNTRKLFGERPERLWVSSGGPKPGGVQSVSRKNSAKQSLTDISCADDGNVLIAEHLSLSV